MLTSKDALAIIFAGLVACSSTRHGETAATGTDAGADVPLPIPPCPADSGPPEKGFYPAPWGHPQSGEQVFFHPADPNVGLLTVRSEKSARIYRTPDGGASWCETTLVASDTGTGAFVFSALDPAVIYARDSTSLSRTIDGGATWTTVAPKLVDGTSIGRVDTVAPHPRWSNVVYAVSFLPRAVPSFLRSEDGGATFESHPLPWQDSGLALLTAPHLAVEGADERVFITGEIQSLGAQVTKKNAMFRWTPGGSPVKLSYEGAGPLVATGSRVYAGGASLSRSDDAGETWTPLPIPAAPGHELAPLAPIDGPGDLVYVVSDLGIFTSHDAGATWSEPRVRPNLLPGDVAIAKDGRLAAHGMEEFAVSNDEGSTWVVRTAYEPLSVGEMFAHGDDVTWGGRRGVGHSSDGLRTWKVPPTQPQRSVIVTLTQDPNDHRILYATNNLGVKKSTDAGDTWAIWPTPRSANVASATEPGLHVLAIAPGDSNLMLARVELGKVDILRSSDGGATWQAVVQVAQYDPFDQQYNLVFAPSDANVAFAGGEGTVHRSTDGGQTWAEARLYPPSGITLEADVRAIAVDPTNPRVVLAVGRTGIHRSIDGGIAWTLTHPAMGGGGFTAHLAFDPFRPDQALAIAQDQLLASADTGQTWRALGPFDYRPRFITFDSKIQDSIYASTGVGMLKSVTGIP